MISNANQRYTGYLSSLFPFQALKTPNSFPTFLPIHSVLCVSFLLMAKPQDQAALVRARSVLQRSGDALKQAAE